MTRIIGQSKSVDQLRRNFKYLELAVVFYWWRALPIDHHFENPLRLLEIWKQKEIEKRGLEGFRIYQKKMFSDGHKVHSIIEDFFNEDRDFGSLGNRLEESDPDVQDYLVSAMPILKNIPMKIHVKALEYPAKHPMLPYCGIIDCIG